ncbi:hypothetical protein Droror1_Dr00022090 [Drosera rotundifolia]
MSTALKPPPSKLSTLFTKPPPRRVCWRKLGFYSSLTYVWPLPSYHTSGADTFSVDPYLSLSFAGDSEIVTEAFERYRSIIFKHVPKVSGLRRFLTGMLLEYDISVVEIVVDNDEEEVLVVVYGFGGEEDQCVCDSTGRWCGGDLQGCWRKWNRLNW